MEYKIAAVSEKVDTWTSSYGEMKTYYVKFEGQAEAIKINQKPDTPAPEVGQTLTGDIVEDKFGKKFKKAAKPGFTASTGNANLTMNNKPDHDSMYRCNALNNAVAWCSAVKQGDQSDVTMIANDFYTWLKGENKGYEAAKATAESLKTPVAKVEVEKTEEVFDGEEINLDDIPF